MIKYRVVKTDSNGNEWYYTGRKDRFREGKNVKPLSYAYGWSQNEETAKLYPASQKKAAYDMARYEKGMVEQVSLSIEVLDVEDFSE